MTPGSENRWQYKVAPGSSGAGGLQAAMQRAPLVGLCAILLFGLALRLISFGGIWGIPKFDEFTYTRIVTLLAHGHYAPIPIQHDIRLGFLIPLALAIKLGGLNDVSLTVYPFVLSMLGIGLVYILSSMMFDWITGLWAALIMAIFPFDQFSASYVSPNQPAATLSVAAITAAFATFTVTDFRRRCAFAVLSGLFQVLALATWEGVLIMVPLCVAVFFTGSSDRRWFLVGCYLSVIAVGAVSAGLFFKHVTGDFFFPLHAIDTVDGIAETFTLRGLPFRFVKLLVTTSAVLPLTILAMSSALVLRKRMLTYPTVWFVSWIGIVLVYSSLAITSFHPVHPLLSTQARYLGVLYYPLIVLSALGASSIVSSSYFMDGA